MLAHALPVLAEAVEERLVAVLGSPGYYGRFGFVPATESGGEPPDPAWGTTSGPDDSPARRCGAPSAT